MSIDLPPASSRLLTQALADLPQRQPGTAGAAAAPAAALLGDTPTATPASSLLDLSPQARLASAASQSAALAQAAVASAPFALPTGGVNAPTQALVNTLLQQFQGSPAPLQASGIQAWPAALLPQLQAGAADVPGAPLAEGLPPLQTWLVQQGTLPTRDGPRSYTGSLYVPADWLGQQNPTAAQPAPGAGARPPAPPLPAALAQHAATLSSGLYALVLQTGRGAPTSALLHIEFAPQQQAAVYGKPLLNPSLDPWQQQAVLQASDERPDLAERPQQGPLCDKPHCPYAGAAACPQPFCPALQVVSPVTGPTALPG